MPVELFTDDVTGTGIATLAAAITTTSATTITTAAAAPTALQTAGGQFRIVIDSEVMIVTAGAATTTWTVTRGAEGSTAATHVNSTTIYHTITAGGLLNLITPLLVAGGNLGASHAETVLAGMTTWLTGTLNASHTLTLTMGAGSALVFDGQQDATGGRTLAISDGTVSVVVPLPTGANAPFTVTVRSPDGVRLIVVGPPVGGTLDQIPAPVAAVNLNNQRIISLADPTGAQDSATKNYVDLLVQGLSPKTAARAGSTVNVTIASPGATIDGVTLVSGDRVLLKDQTTASQNGIYLFNGSAVAMTRALDAVTWNELVSAFLFVSEGTVNADKAYVCTSDKGGTLGTTAVTFVLFTTGGAGSLPSASAAGQAPVSTGAGTTYTAQGVPLLSNYTAKGEITVGTGAGTTAQLAPGPDGSRMVPDSSLANGAKYVDASSNGCEAVDQGYVAQSYDIALSSTAFGQAPASGVLLVTRIPLRTAKTVTHLDTYTFTAPSGATTQAGVYLALFNAAGTRLGVSADMTSTFAAGLVLKPSPLTADSAGSLDLKPGIYFAVILVVTAATTPMALQKTVAGTSIANANLTGASLRAGTVLTAQTVMPASFVPANLVAAGVPWMAIG